MNVFLDDDPIVKHDDITEAIANEVSQTVGNGKIIGLLGGWGSGKSSQIQGVKNLVRSKCQVIEYDTWKNESYPFKLGFLNYLLGDSCYDDKPLIEDKDTRNNLTNKLLYLQKIKEKQSSIKYSIINFPNALIALSLIFYTDPFEYIENSKFVIPAANIVFWWSFVISISLLVINYLLEKNGNIKNALKAIKHSFKYMWNNWRSLDCWKKIGVLAIKFVVKVMSLVLIAWLTHFANGKYLKDVFIFIPMIIWGVFNLDKVFFKIFGTKKYFFLLPETTPCSESIVTINKSPEPSFSDFIKLFKDIMDKENSGKNIVIVIDNLDRVDPSEAKNIWASVKGMLLKEKRVFVIIPLDEDQIPIIYEDNTKSLEDETASFIQKTFDIVFRLPVYVNESVESIWKEKLSKSLNITSDIDIAKIINIFNTRNDVIKDGKPSSYRGNATPRKIIKLINEVVVLNKIKCFSDIDIYTKFAYCVHYNNIKSKLQKNSLENLLPSTSMLLNDIKPEALVALYYMLDDENKAFRIVKKEQIIKQMKEGTLFSDEDVSGNWLPSLLQDIMPQQIDMSYSAVLNTIKCIIDAQERNKSFSSGAVKYLLKLSVDNLKTQIQLNDIPQDTLPYISKALNQLTVIKPELLILSLYNIGEAVQKKADIWVELYKIFIDSLKLDKNALERIKNIPPLPIEFYRKVVPLLDTSIFSPKIITVDADSTILDENLTLNADVIKICNFIVEGCNENDVEWQENKNAIYSLLSHDISSNVLNVLYKIILKYQDCEDFKDLAQSGSLVEYMIEKAANTDIAMQCLAMFLLSGGDIDAINNEDSDFYITILQMSNEYVEHFVKYYLELIHYDFNKLYDLPEDMLENKNIINFAYEKFLDKQQTSIEDFIKAYDINCEEYNKEFLLKYFIANHKECLMNCSFSSQNKKYQLFLLKKHNDKAIESKVHTFLDSFQYDKLAWKKEITLKSDLFKLAILSHYEGAEYRDILSDTIINNLVVDPKWLDNIDDVMEELHVLNKSLNFINDALDQILQGKKESYDKILEKFPAESLVWFEKTNHDRNTLYVDFVRKVKNVHWLVTNKNELYPVIEANRDSFVNSWQNNEDIRNAYNELFENNIENKEPKESL